MKSMSCRRAVNHIVAIVVAAGYATPGFAAVGDWAEGTNVRVRLIAAGVGPAGSLAAALEIELADGWKTYWRTPGDAGFAPLIDMSASSNIGPVEVSYPVPHRVDDGYFTSNVYEDRVVFPLSGIVTDPHSAVGLSLKLDLGVCAEVCIPEHLETTLTVAPGEKDASVLEIISAAASAVPGEPEPGVFSVASVWRNGGPDSRPVFDFKAVTPEAAEQATVFVEGPPDWAPAPPSLVGKSEGGAVYRVEFSRLGATTPIAGAPFRVTIVSGDRAIEQTLNLD
jgi:suppressor for copper-sensitivity B